MFSNFDIGIPFRLGHRKKYEQNTDIQDGSWNLEEINILRAKKVTKQNILLLLSKYQKQVITAALNGEYVIVLLPTTSGKSRM